KRGLLRSVSCRRAEGSRIPGPPAPGRDPRTRPPAPGRGRGRKNLPQPPRISPLVDSACARRRQIGTAPEKGVAEVDFVPARRALAEKGPTRPRGATREPRPPAPGAAGADKTFLSGPGFHRWLILGAPGGG